MKRFAFVLAVTLLAATGVMLAAPHSPPPERRDATTIRPEFRIDPTGGMLRIRGVIRVVNPDAPHDHTAAVRLSIIDPETEEAVHTEDLAAFDYHRNHPKDFAYPIDFEAPIDVAGFAVKVAVVDAMTGHEFCSMTLR